MNESMRQLDFLSDPEPLLRLVRPNGYAVEVQVVREPEPPLPAVDDPDAVGLCAREGTEVDLSGFPAAEHEPDFYGRDLFGEIVRRASSGPLAERFTFPPFSVLDGRGGEWLERKRAWLALGIDSEVGRTEGVSFGPGIGGPKTITLGVCNNITAGTSPDMRKAFEAMGTGASVFDPVLCELVYRWFSPAGGQVVDPFAGGSVRGVVAGSLGRRYWGSELRPEQVLANVTQRDVIAPAVPPVWVEGDAMEKLEGAPEADLLFTCPPYGDLEVYSDDPRDLSTMEWHTFCSAHKRIVMRALGRLRNDSFACWVVGDFRCAKGYLRGFVAATVRAFEECGARFYNEAILITPVGSAGIRAPGQFPAGRKLVRTHQHLLVFVKGEGRAAAARCGEL